jgi:hypothetical protein
MAGTFSIAGQAQQASLVYSVAVPSNSFTPGVDRGIVASVNLTHVFSSAYADAGWSGGVVVNSRGQVAGVILKDVGSKWLRTFALKVEHVHMLAVRHAQSGFCT